MGRGGRGPLLLEREKINSTLLDVGIEKDDKKQETATIGGFLLLLGDAAAATAACHLSRIIAPSSCSSSFNSVSTLYFLFSQTLTH